MTGVRLLERTIILSHFAAAVEPAFTHDGSSSKGYCMHDIAKKLNALANITIIIVGVIIVALLVKRQFFSEPLFSTNNFQIGKRVPLEEITWDQNDQTLFLVITEKCHFCTSGMPFYRQLAEMRNGQNKFKLVVITTGRGDEGKRYVNSLGITIDEIKQVTDKTIGIVRVPSIILANSSGIVTDIWTGKLTSVQETEVLDRLKGVGHLVTQHP
ncbi:MAG TPA: hypothetical protein VJ810_23125 [Blastocatellia bacterium]|nr:hypothetical protein [Blastocatellia bacterium]